MPENKYFELVVREVNDPLTPAQRKQVKAKWLHFHVSWGRLDDFEDQPPSFVSLHLRLWLRLVVTLKVRLPVWWDRAHYSFQDLPPMLANPAPQDDPAPGDDRRFKMHVGLDDFQRMQVFVLDDLSMTDGQLTAHREAEVDIQQLWQLHGRTEAFRRALIVLVADQWDLHPLTVERILEQMMTSFQPGWWPSQ